MLEKLRGCYQFKSKAAALEDACESIFIELLCQDISMSGYSKLRLVCSLNPDPTAAGYLLVTIFTHSYAFIVLNRTMKIIYNFA
jgi:hypothetical protein